MRSLSIRALVIVAAVIACAYAPYAQPKSMLPDFEMAELWQDPADLAQRDLFYGPGGQALAPPASGATYEFVAFKTAGTQPGYDVRDSAGRLWSVKLGVEAQPEVTASRILWAIGFHQPPTYFVHEFTLTGTDAGLKTVARFRTDFDQWKSGEEWDWYDNAFKNSKQFRGLVVANLILNQWDFKPSNNRIYQAVDASVKPRKLFVVRDLGASLGEMKQSTVFKVLGTAGAQGSKNDIEDFEQQGFIKKVDGTDVSFDYRGMNQALVDLPMAADVVWACELMSRISDEQWQAAFRAGAYPDDIAARYIRKIKQKIADGLAIRTPATP